jgi:hypothetical protein
VASEQEGGGASRSTRTASGSSAPTDVSLREHVTAKIDALDRHLTAEIAALRRETKAANEAAKDAIEVAKHEATERLASHNGLIEKMEEQATHFASRDSVDDYKETANQRFGRIEKFQYMLTGGILIVSFIGISNLVKVWTG